MKKKNLRIGGAAVLVLGGAARMASAQYQTTNFVTSTAPGGSAPSDFVSNVQFGDYGTRSPAIEPVFNAGSVTLAGSGYSDSALALIDSDGTSSGGGAYGMYGNTDALLNFTFLSGTSNGNVQFGMAERIDGSGGNVFGHGSSAPLVPGNYNDYPDYYCNFSNGKLTLLQQGYYTGGALPGTQLAQQTGISLAGGADTYKLEMSTQGGATPTITVTLTQNSTVVGLVTATGSVLGYFYEGSAPDLQGEVGFYGGSNNWSGTSYGIQATAFSVNPVTGPATVTWSGAASGSWDTASSNWQSAALYADTDLVVFDDTATSNFTVDLGGATVNPGNVTVNNTINAYSIGNGTIGGNGTLTKNGTNTLILTGASTYSGGTTVNAGTLDVATATNGLLAGSNVANYAALQFDGTQTLGAISGNGTTTVNGSLTVTNITQASLVNNGAVSLSGTSTLGSLADASGNGVAGNTTVVGSLTVSGSFAQASLINNGTVQLNGNGTIGQLSGTGSLSLGNGTLANTVVLSAAATSGVLGGIKPTQGLVTIASGSTLDITNNALLLNYGNGTSPLAMVANAVAFGAGIGNNSSNGAIISSTVNNSAAGKYAVGYADHTEISTVPTGNVEVAYTLAGDANLDGSVDILDYQQMAPHYDEAGTYDWSQGDFNHDGHVDILDYQAMAPNYDTKLTAGTLTGASLTEPIGSTLLSAAKPIGSAVAADAIMALNMTTAVPEPASLSLLLLGGLPLLGRRRRRTANR